MLKRGNLAYIVVIIGALLAPTVISLGYYAVSKNPALRPLAITQKALRSYEAGKGQAGLVVVRVDWVDGASMGYTQDQLYHLIDRAFAAKGVEIDMAFFAAEGRTRVTYIVGRSWMGPYQLDQAATGISAAATAYHMAENGS